MIFVQTFDNPNELHWSANMFENLWYSDVFRRKSIKCGISFIMTNNDRYVFILESEFPTWEKGRTYELINRPSEKDWGANYIPTKTNNRFRLIRRDKKDRAFAYFRRHVWTTWFE